MKNNSPALKIALVSTVIVIALALGLFVSAAGFADLRLAVAFGLQAVLAIALVLHILRYSKPEAPAAGETYPRDKAAKKKAKETASAGDAATQDQSTEIITDTAGELRTSLEVMQEELEEILDEEVPADKEHMESLYQETDRLRKIIDGMEQLAEAQALAREFKKEPVQVEPLLKGVVERTQSAHPERKIAYTIECDPSVIMTADRECVNRIIGNIADNAAKSVKGTGSVVLAAIREGDGIVFSVRDTGTGIRRAHLPHLYERFFRGTGSGVGMGLAVVKELVDACGGKIGVESAAGKGTTFTVKLPEA
jgi:signal transduction histidine kinase